MNRAGGEKKCIRTRRNGGQKDADPGGARWEKSAIPKTKAEAAAGAEERLAIYRNAGGTMGPSVPGVKGSREGEGHS